MSVDRFCNLFPRAKFGNADKKWFPRWLKRYSSFINAEGGQLSVSREQVIAFSQALHDNGVFAWQRLQAVRAVEAYQNLVFK